MNMIFSLFVVSVLGFCIVPSDAGLQFKHGDLANKDSTDQRLNERFKRGDLQIARAALDYLIRDAKILHSFGDSRIYLKEGGYRAALKDFKAVHPTQVEMVHDVKGIVRTSGWVGNKQIIMEKGHGTKSTTVKIAKNCCESPSVFKTRNEFNVFIYKDL